MTQKIIISEQERSTDISLELLFSGPLALLDPRHPAVNENLQKQILYSRYHQKLIADGLETGHFFYNENNQLVFQTKLPIHSFAGFIFEAYAVNIFNENIRTIGKSAFSWCTNRSQCKDDYIDQFKVIGTGFITTKSQYPNFYSPQNRFDLIFIRKNSSKNVDEPATVLGTTNTAGIQIKAITGSEEIEIIEPIRSGKYSHVLTFLRHADGVHSYNRCMEAINSMYRKGSLQLSEKYQIESRISHPEMFGIDQRNVDDYYNYVLHWFNGHAKPDQFIQEGVGLEVKGYKYSNGLLVPNN
ncbi:hypothetical protein [Diaphorobacter nitroreducens]|uniref:hypothetical protein n=1 Tax=Diaphorobacter nitroreducens TaxID=164759 RepID=UPI000B59E79A|nr:hypothetical protein [Diaphorobacter nitroreducens]